VAMVIGYVITSATNNLYTACIVGIGLSACGSVACFAFLPEQLKSFKEIQAKMLEKTESQPTPRAAKLVIYMIMVATFFDTLGSQGLATAQGSSAAFVYAPDFAGISQGLMCVTILPMLVGFGILPMFQSALTKGGVKMKYLQPIVCFISNLWVAFWEYFIGFVFFSLTPAPNALGELVPSATRPMGLWPYIVVCYMGQLLLSTWSGATNDIMVSMVSPPDKRGYWGGRMRFAQNAVICFGPIVVSIISQPPGMSDYAQIFASHKTMCTIFGSISVLGGLLYLPLLSVYRPPDPKPPKELTEEELDKVLDMPEGEWQGLAPKRRHKLNERRMVKGKPVYFRKWGQFEDEKDMAPSWADDGLKMEEIEIYQDMVVATASDRAKMAEMAQAMKDNNANIKKANEEQLADMGKWVADYFESAGYKAWSTSPDLFKIMITTAFPPVYNIDFDNAGVEEVETMLLNFQTVLNKSAADVQSTKQKRQLDGWYNFLQSLISGSQLRKAFNQLR